VRKYFEVNEWTVNSYLVLIWKWSFLHFIHQECQIQGKTVSNHAMGRRIDFAQIEKATIQNKGPDYGGEAIEPFLSHSCSLVFSLSETHSCIIWISGSHFSLICLLISINFGCCFWLMEGKKWGYSSNEDISNDDDDDVNLQNASDEDGDLHFTSHSLPKSQFRSTIFFR